MDLLARLDRAAQRHAAGSDALVHACAIARPSAGVGVEAQAADCLTRMEGHLLRAGGSRRTLLLVVFYLCDLALKPQLNLEWGRWLGGDALLPARAAVGVGSLGRGVLLAASAIALTIVSPPGAVPDPGPLPGPMRHGVEPGLFHLVTQSGTRLIVSGISAEMELGDAMMPRSGECARLPGASWAVLVSRMPRCVPDPLTQTAAILRTVGRALRTAADAPPSACREATVYLTEAAAGAAAAITKLLGEWAPGCAVTLVDVTDLGPDTHVEVLVSAELPTRGRGGRLRLRSIPAAL